MKNDKAHCSLFFSLTINFFHIKYKEPALKYIVSWFFPGLFHKIIAFSGSPSTPFLHNDRKSVCYGRAFAKKVLENQLKEHTSVNDEELLEMLKDVPSQIIGEHMTLFKDWDT